jgi:hypothetical protein
LRAATGLEHHVTADVLGDRELRAALGRRAHDYSRAMVWSAVGADYRRLLSRVVARAPLTEFVGSLATVNA